MLSDSLCHMTSSLCHVTGSLWEMALAVALFWGSLTAASPAPRSVRVALGTHTSFPLSVGDGNGAATCTASTALQKFEIPYIPFMLSWYHALHQEYNYKERESICGILSKLCTRIEYSHVPDLPSHITFPTVLYVVRYSFSYKERESI